MDTFSHDSIPELRAMVEETEHALSDRLVYYHHRLPTVEYRIVEMRYYAIPFRGRWQYFEDLEEAEKSLAKNEYLQQDFSIQHTMHSLVNTANPQGVTEHYGAIVQYTIHDALVPFKKAHEPQTVETLDPCKAATILRQTCSMLEQYEVQLAVFCGLDEQCRAFHDDVYQYVIHHYDDRIVSGEYEAVFDILFAALGFSMEAQEAQYHSMMRYGEYFYEYLAQYTTRVLSRALQELREDTTMHDAPNDWIESMLDYRGIWERVQYHQAYLQRLRDAAALTFRQIGDGTVEYRMRYAKQKPEPWQRV